MKTNQPQKNIPSGWQQVELGDCLERIEGGGTPAKEKAEYWNGSIPWASVKDVVTHNSNDTQDHISEIGLKNSSSRLVKKGTLIVPTRMALGHAVVFDVDVAINQDLKALYPKKDLLNQYLYHWFKSKKEFIERLGSGSTVSGIQQNELKKIKFNLPPIPEQNRIVSVLEIWDKSIAKFSKKIEAKKQIKKGLMQDLLTGKKRLKGFSGRWETEKLGDLTSVVVGGTPRTEIKEYWGGDIEWLSSGDLRQTYIFKASKKITKDGLLNCSAKIMPVGTVLLAMTGATLGEIAFLNIEAAGNQSVAGFIPNKNFNSEFLFFILKNSKNKIEDLSSGAAQVGINKKNIESLKFNFPKIEEQKAISEILTTTDREIQELEKKLQIIKDQKKYLLNNLITGTIRTPETLSTKVIK